MIQHYDDVAINDSMLLDLPMREGTGIITQDVAAPHHPVTLVNTPTWVATDEGLMTLAFNGTTEYGQCLNASCADLGFTTEDYSVGLWFGWVAGGNDSQILIGRYEVSVGGWELYLYQTLTLTMRHHHAGGASARSAYYSAGWSYNTWHFMGFARSGTAGTFYRNGVAVDTIGGPFEDPEATTRDLVMGCRYTKDTNFLKGTLYRPRVWNRALTAAEWAQIYEQESGWFA